MNTPRGSKPEDSELIDELLRQRFALPDGLPARAARMIMDVTGPPVARRTWPWAWLAAAATALLCLWIATRSSPAGPAPYRLNADELLADATVAFPAPVAACTTESIPKLPTVEFCTTAPPLPYVPGLGELLVGPLSCPSLPQAHRYWSRNAENTVLLLILPADDPRAVEWSGVPVAAVERRTGALRVLFVSTAGPAAATQRATQLR